MSIYDDDVMCLNAYIYIYILQTTFMHMNCDHPH